MKKYTEEDIRLAIDMCQKHRIQYETPSIYVLGGEIETIECSYFLYNLDIVRKKRKSETTNRTNKVIPPPPKPPESRFLKEGKEPPKPKNFNNG